MTTIQSRSIPTGSPRVSVGVPVFNAEAFLDETLDSLLAQSFSDYEIIISDNGSTDRTEAICRSYAARDSRIHYHRHQTNRGAAWNHNRVFSLARGEYFKWAAADDVCAPEYLEKCVTALDRDPAAVLACSNVMEIDEGGRALGLRMISTEAVLGTPVSRFRRNIRLDHLCLHVYGVIRSAILRQTELIGPFTDSDRVLLAHLVLFGHFVLIPETLLLNRHHPGRSTQVHVGWRARTVWFDPSTASRRTYPFWTELASFKRAISMTPLRASERVACYWALIGWLWEYKKFLLYDDLSYYPRLWITSNVPGAKAAWSWLRAVGARGGVRQS